MSRGASNDFVRKQLLGGPDDAGEEHLIRNPSLLLRQVSLDLQHRVGLAGRGHTIERRGLGAGNWVCILVGLARRTAGSMLAAGRTVDDHTLANNRRALSGRSWPRAGWWMRNQTS